MGSGIYLIKNDGQFIELNEELYDSEDVLQSLLEKYPNLLAGEQVDTDIPRRWLLVRREMGLPGEPSGNPRWSIDHVFLDQDGIPTLVEVKRSTDPRARREVVAQMLDYAANAVTYWPVETVKDNFEDTCRSKKLDPKSVIASFLPPGIQEEQFWQTVKSNLHGGRIRLLFVADEIPSELRRVVEFLNAQMDPAEVLALEIKQYIGQGLKTLVPRVIGQTAEAQRRKLVLAGRSPAPSDRKLKIILGLCEQHPDQSHRQIYDENKESLTLQGISRPTYYRYLQGEKCAHASNKPAPSELVTE